MEGEVVFFLLSVLWVSMFYLSGMPTVDGYV